MTLPGCKTILRMAALLLGLTVLAACARPPLIGLVYTHIHIPLTWDLNATQLPASGPSHLKTVEIKEPLSGIGFYARVHSNAIGDIAKSHGLQTLHFADQEIFSLFGIFNTVRVNLYGEE